MLETEEHALARGAHIYAELLGSGNNNDAFHITTPRDGEKAERIVFGWRWSPLA